MTKNNFDRLKNDLSKEQPYLMLENDRFAKSLIDNDAQVIIILNIVYVLTVGKTGAMKYFNDKYIDYLYLFFRYQKFKV